jgi:primosomal protein N'
MYIITVIPIQKGFQNENLTYFSHSNIELGSIVTVPIRKKTADAIVINIENAIDLKSELKEKDYQLKKIIKIRGDSPFTKTFFTACERMREYTVSNTGSIIKSLLPNIFLENIQSLKKQIENSEIENQLNNFEKVVQEKLIFQALTEDRLAFYRTLIRESFAKKESVFICVPTRYDIEIFREALTKGIEQYVYSFHNEMGKKILISKYNEAILDPHPIIIIGTGMFLSIPRYDIKTIILEHESSDSYKQYGRPYIDIRNFVEVLSSVLKIKLILGDTILRPETLYRNEQGELDEISSPLFRLPQAEREIIVDMREEIDQKGLKKFTILSDSTKQMIEYALEHNESVLLFSIRKGLAPLTICHDCGHTLLCPSCTTPVVLYGSKQNNINKKTASRIFMCNKCGRKETTETRCSKCQSWNLVPLGIGTDRVNEEIRNLYPSANIIQIDKETTTDKEARIAIEKFNKTPGTILICTEMAFSYLRTQVIHSAVISLDGLLSIPSFNITQKVIHTIEKLQYITKRNLLIQTRIKENPILEHALSGNVLPLFREDLLERKAFGYPPFKRLIKIRFTGTPSETEKARSFINKELEDYDPQIFSAFIAKVRGQYVTNTVIKVNINDWPLPTNTNKTVNPNLLEILSRLPPSFSINVDPEDLL